MAARNAYDTYYEEAKMERRYGHNAKGMRDQMLAFLRRRKNPLLWKWIASLIYDGKCELISSSEERYHVCLHCGGGGSWFYNYETPRTKFPFQLVYFFAPAEFAYETGAEPEEFAHVFFFNREERITRELRDEAGYVMQTNFLDYFRLWQPESAADLFRIMLELKDYGLRNHVAELLEEYFPTCSLEEQLHQAVECWKFVYERENKGTLPPKYYTFDEVLTDYNRTKRDRSSSSSFTAIDDSGNENSGLSSEDEEDEEEGELSSEEEIEIEVSNEVGL